MWNILFAAFRVWGFGFCLVCIVASWISLGFRLSAKRKKRQVKTSLRHWDWHFSIFCLFNDQTILLENVALSIMKAIVIFQSFEEHYFCVEHYSIKLRASVTCDLIVYWTLRCSHCPVESHMWVIIHHLRCTQARAHTHTHTHTHTAEQPPVDSWHFQSCCLCCNWKNIHWLVLSNKTPRFLSKRPQNKL